MDIKSLLFNIAMARTPQRRSVLDWKSVTECRTINLLNMTRYFLGKYFMGCIIVPSLVSTRGLIKVLCEP